MDGIERRYVPLEHRGDGRVLSGTAIRYGDVATLPGGLRERFEPGAFGDVLTADVILNRQHQRGVPLARTGGGGLVLDDDLQRLAIHAELPETRDASDTLELVRSGVLRGLSIEFRALRETMRSGVRVISSARLAGVAVVDNGAYSGSDVAVRALDGGRRRLWL